MDHWPGGTSDMAARQAKFAGKGKGVALSEANSSYKNASTQLPIACAYFVPVSQEVRRHTELRRAHDTRRAPEYGLRGPGSVVPFKGVVGPAPLESAFVESATSGLRAGALLSGLDSSAGARP